MDRFDRRYGVKQYVAVVQNRYGNRFMVFTTNDDRFYLFSAVDDGGFQTGLQWPVRKTDLRDDIQRALANGWGNADLSQRPQWRIRTLVPRGAEGLTTLSDAIAATRTARA